jgi:hypothetical protein
VVPPELVVAEIHSGREPRQEFPWGDIGRGRRLDKVNARDGPKSRDRRGSSSRTGR